MKKIKRHSRTNSTKKGLHDPLPQEVTNAPPPQALKHSVADQFTDEHSILLLQKSSENRHLDLNDLMKKHFTTQNL